MYFRLLADGYQAVVATESVTSLCNEDSHLLQMLNHAMGDPDPAVHLNCSEAVAKEAVEALRLGSRYFAPADHRLLNAVQHQLDYLGVSVPGMP